MKTAQETAFNYATGACSLWARVHAVNGKFPSPEFNLVMFHADMLLAMNARRLLPDYTQK